MSKSNLAVTEKKYTPEEYLAFEREAEEKHEFIDGEIIAMAGASREHNLIGVNVSSELRFASKGKSCEVYANDMRVRMKENRYGYPDVVVICGKPEFDDEEFDVLLNPTIAVEVLSKSTKLKDRNEKLDSYMSLEDLTDYALIEQDTMRIEHFIKINEKEWNVRLLTENADKLVLDSINCEVSLEEIYREVKFSK